MNNSDYSSDEEQEPYTEDESTEEITPIQLTLSSSTNVAKIDSAGIAYQELDKVLATLEELHVFTPSGYAIFTGQLSEPLKPGETLTLKNGNDTLLNKVKIEAGKHEYESTCETVQGEKSKIHFHNPLHMGIMAIIPKAYLPEYYEIP